jgi:predicted lipid-binding transport protein (Tim44 family)
LPVLVPPLLPVLPVEPDVPAPAAAPPLLAPVEAAGVGLAGWLAAGAAAGLELDALELAVGAAVLVVLVVAGVVVELVLEVVGGVAASAEVGMVSAGASAVSACGGELEPQPARAKATTTSAAGMSRDAGILPWAIAAIMKLRAAPSGARSGDSR